MMKLTRIMLIVVFLFALISTPAQAQGGRVGWVVLVPQPDPNQPLEYQVRLMLGQLLPELLSAKKAGLVARYKVDYFVGLLSIEYTGSLPESLLRGRLPVYADQHEAIARLQPIQPGVQGSGDVIAAGTPHFTFGLYSQCVGVFNAGANSRVLIYVKDSIGNSVGVGENKMDASGGGVVCLNSTYVVPGNKITAKVYTPANLLLGTYTATTPTLTFTAINKANSVVSGKAPASKAYSIKWSHKAQDALGGYGSQTLTGTVSGAGDWSKDFGASPFVGGDEFEITVTLSANFYFHTRFVAPVIYCFLSYGQCTVFGIPRQAASLSITHAGVTHTAAGKFGNDGSFTNNLLDALGNPIVLASGDTVTGTGLPAWTLPTLSAAINYTTDVVSGSAPANRWFDVQVSALQTWVHYVGRPQSNAQSLYSYDFTSKLDLQPLSVYEIAVIFTSPVTGNMTYWANDFYP